MKIRFYPYWLALTALVPCGPVSHAVDVGADIILNSPDDFPGTNPTGQPTYIVSDNLAITDKFPTSYRAITFQSSPETKGLFNLSFKGNGTNNGLQASSGKLQFSGLKDISLSYFNIALSCGTSNGVLFSDNSGVVSLTNNKAVFNNNPGGSFTFSDNKGDLRIRKNTIGVQTFGSIYLNNNQGNIIAQNNVEYAFCGNNIEITSNRGNMDFSYNSGRIGSSISALGNVIIIHNIGNINFSYNSSEENLRGGNIYAQGSGGIQIVGNEGKITFTGNYSGAAGGALDASFGNVDVSNNRGEILFQGNTVSGHGGAIFASQDIHISNNKGSISFIDNMDIAHKSSGGGGAIYSEQTLYMGANTGNILFERNTAGLGGAIIALKGLSIAGNLGTISFLDNGALNGYGGAIFTRGISLVGNMGDIIFRSNYVQSPDGLVLNSIYNNQATGQIIVPKGYTVYFYDPILSSSPLELNNIGTNSAFTGDIVFSGKYTEEDWQKILDNSSMLTPVEKSNLQNQKDKLVEESRYSYITADITLYGGQLILEDGVTVGDKDIQNAANTFTAKSGSILEIVRGSTLSFQNVVLEPGVKLRVGDGAAIHGETVDMSQGVIVDFAPFMEHASSGVTIQATKGFYMGGHIYVADTESNVNYYYADNKWSREQRFQTFSMGKDSEASVKGQFVGAASLATGTPSIISPYIYQGTWSTEWEDSDGDGISDTMFVVWKPIDQENPEDPTDPDHPGQPDDPGQSDPPSPAIKDILPELAGNLTMSTSWTSASNARAISNAAIGNLGKNRFKMQEANNYWIKGLGDFSNQGTQGTSDGYDYNGGGYAVGVDRKITDNGILGIAFGNIFGKNSSRSYIGNIDQTSDMILAYGGWRKEINGHNAFSITGSAGYGNTENTMKSFHTGGWSQGKWDNDTILATLKTQWEHDLGANWNVNAFAGVEYADVTQKSFQETGWDARRFEQGRMKNLSLPIGLGISKLTTLWDKPWQNTLSVSYVPDVYRDNPHATATRLMNGYSWTARGISQDRHAVRINFDSTLAITPNWTAYAGYEFEGRNRTVYHRINAGISFSY